MKTCRYSTLLPICVSLTTGGLFSATLIDDFEANHDYYNGGGGANVSGTIWDGIINYSAQEEGNTTTNDGLLTLDGIDPGDWTDNLSTGPFLSKDVTGNFSVKVFVDEMESGLRSGGLIAYKDGGPSGDWLLHTYHPGRQRHLWRHHHDKRHFG